MDIFPQAHIYTGFRKPINVSQKILSQKIISGKIPSWLGFLMPLVFEGFDLKQYDIVISEGTAWPKGVITSPKQLHISYIYTPPRFLYGYATEGQKRDAWYLKPFLKIIDHFLRLWDYHASQRPDFILSISQEVAKRVKKFYGRDSQVIYPPVDAASDQFPRPSRSGSRASQPTPQIAQELVSNDYYLCISRLAAYKNIDLLIKAFNKTGLKLKVAGTGKEEGKLKTLAKESIEMLGFVNDEEKHWLLQNCKGFIFPTDYEDFGIVVVEALSYGKPVLCHRSGGPLEIITDGETGTFFDDLKPEKLAEKIIEFDKNIDDNKYEGDKAYESAKKFSAERFKREFSEYIAQRWEEKQNARTS